MAYRSPDMPDPAEAVHWRGPGPGEAPVPGPGALDVTEAAQWLAVTSGAAEEDLDLALMAWLGPGTCGELATIVGRPTESGEGSPGEGVPLDRALELAPAVAAHVSACAPCSDRLRAMVSVGEVLRRGRPATPGEARFLHPSGTPTGLDGGPPPRDPRHGLLATHIVRPSLAAAVLAGGGAAAAIAYLAWPSPSPKVTPVGSAVPALSRLPPGGSTLVLDPAATTSAVLHLSDVGARAVTWQAATTAPWLRVAPTAGQLQPGQSVSLALQQVGGQVSGLRATVTVNGSDGSVAAARYSP